MRCHTIFPDCESNPGMCLKNKIQKQLQEPKGQAI